MRVQTPNVAVSIRSENAHDYVGVLWDEDTLHLGSVQTSNWIREGEVDGFSGAVSKVH
jgi:hypothetical protein